MTNNEIIKALSTVTYGGHSCTKCKHKISKGEERCGFKGCNIARNALSLINRQKAEIESLQQKYELSEAEREANVKGFTESLETVKAEAIKGFASKLTPRLLKEMDEQGLMPSAYVKKVHAYTEIELFINEIVKEMTENQ